MGRRPVLCAADTQGGCSSRLGSWGATLQPRQVEVLLPTFQGLWGAASLGCLTGTEQVWFEGCPAGCPFQPVANAQAPVGFLPSHPFHFQCRIPQLSACRPTAGPAWPTFALWAFSHMLMCNVQDLSCSRQMVWGKSVSIPKSRRWLSERVLRWGSRPVAASQEEIQGHQAICWHRFTVTGPPSPTQAALLFRPARDVRGTPSRKDGPLCLTLFWALGGREWAEISN